MSKKYKKVCVTLNYIEHFLILASVVTGCVSISAFASLFGIPVRITLGIPIGIRSSVIELKGLDTAGIKKNMPIIKKKKKKHDKMVLSAKTK